MRGKRRLRESSNGSRTADATTNAPDRSVAVVYDPVGLHPAWLAHLDWLGSHIRGARWVKATEAAWQLADWEA